MYYSNPFLTASYPPPSTDNSQYTIGFPWMDIKNFTLYFCTSCTENLSPFKNTDKYVLTWAKVNFPCHENRIHLLEQTIKDLTSELQKLKNTIDNLKDSNE